jgi:MarR family transcriptional regulator, lower aerobic nicotinate degradation pathway regulator
MEMDDPLEVLTALALDGPAPYLVRRLQQHVTAIFSEEMEGYDITGPQYGTLAVVVAYPNLDQNTTAFLAGVERTTMVGVINRLVKSGLLKRTTSKSDKRLRLLQPTEAGIRFVHKVRGSVQRMSTRLLDPLPAEQRAALCETMRELLRDRVRKEATQLRDWAQIRQLLSRTDLPLSSTKRRPR